MRKSITKVVERHGNYRIVDDGNCHTFHIFTVERCKMHDDCEVWECVTKPTADWKTVYTEYTKLINEEQ